MVQACANILLGKDRTQVKSILLSHRAEALQAFRVAWGRVKMAEKSFYGAKSFFLK